jgi:phosphoribosylformimino-5-aminoimidazole carboxamide ribotide isomerase
MELIRTISRETGLNVQTGGGIRTLSHLETLLESGIARAVLGTAAVRDRALISEILQRWPDRVAIGIDARDGEVSVDGWTHGSGLSTLEFARTMEELGRRQSFLPTSPAMA